MAYVDYMSKTDYITIDSALQTVRYMRGTDAVESWMAWYVCEIKSIEIIRRNPQR